MMWVYVWSGSFYTMLSEIKYVNLAYIRLVFLVFSAILQQVKEPVQSFLYAPLSVFPTQLRVQTSPDIYRGKAVITLVAEFMHKHFQTRRMFSGKKMPVVRFCGPHFHRNVYT